MADVFKCSLHLFWRLSLFGTVTHISVQGRNYTWRRNKSLAVSCYECIKTLFYHVFLCDTHKSARCTHVQLATSLSLNAAVIAFSHAHPLSLSFSLSCARALNTLCDSLRKHTRCVWLSLKRRRTHSFGRTSRHRGVIWGVPWVILLQCNPIIGQTSFI